MNDTQTSILKGCKFFLGPGSERWDSDLTRRALKRMIDLCTEELNDRTKDTMTPEETEKLFTTPINETT